LKHFEKISLLPSEEKTVSLQLNSRDFAYYNTKIHDWTVRTGKFDIRVGGSSRNLPLQQTIAIENTKPIKVVYTRDSMVKEIKSSPQGEVIVNQLIQGFMGTNNKLETEEDKKTAAFFAAMFGDLPINKFILLSGGKFTEDNMNAILTAVNKN
jgi:beta-glucosidase